LDTVSNAGVPVCLWRVSLQCQLTHWCGLLSQILLDDDAVAHHQLTTEEIREYCADVKVLGKPALKYDLHVVLLFSLVCDMILCRRGLVCYHISDRMSAAESFCDY